VTTLIKTCRSERKAEDNQQVVTNADQLLAPSLSTLSSRFATICHNYDYIFMTAARLPWARTDRLQQLKANPNGMKRSDSGTLLA
jgi:hypothetical protein